MIFQLFRNTYKESVKDIILRICDDILDYFLLII